MILKKPYAFLIKYFKLINILICGLAIYIAYNSYSIYSFFSEYINNNYSGNYYESFYTSYISPFTYLVFILIILGILVVNLLLIYKKKPTKFYIFSFIYYTIILIFLSFIKNIMITLETSVITAETARIYRDLSLIFFVPQIYIVIMYLFRGFGVNLKKFNFEKDLKELEINEEDNEEVEITLNRDNIKIKRNIKRYFREFKYYIKENKFIFIIICLIFMFIAGVFIYNLIPKKIDKEYIQGDSFVINNLNYKIEDSIITNIDYKGDRIKKDKYYLVIKIKIDNNTDRSIAIDYNSFRLEIDSKSIYPLLDKSKHFIDYAKDNYTKEINKKSSELYAIIYEIDAQDLNKKTYEIKIPNGRVFNDNIELARYNYIKITPAIINKVVTEKKINQSEEIIFSNSNLGNTKITLSNPVIAKEYIYQYKSCIKDICNNYKDIITIDYTYNTTTLIVLDYKYEFDYEVPFYNHSTKFNNLINSFMKIKYKDENDKDVYATIKNITPNKLDGKIVIETTNKIEKSNDINISFVIRNKEYLVKIK